jgi:hypothetical protein
MIMKITIRPSKKDGCGYTLTIDGKYFGTYGTRMAAKAAAFDEVQKQKSN